jgi:hypothetical protein
MNLNKRQLINNRNIKPETVESDTYPDSKSDTHSHVYPDCDANRNGDGDSNCHTDCDSASIA